MREILFRGKLDERIDEWIKGSLWYDRDHTAHIIGSRYWGEMSKDELLSLELISWTVIPETVGQYTGLIDKNGKKIFEGDIVRDVETSDVGKICFDTDTARFVVEFAMLIIDFSCYNNGDVEVIGNIYDNPELIGGEANG